MSLYNNNNTEYYNNIRRKEPREIVTPTYNDIINIPIPKNQFYLPDENNLKRRIENLENTLSNLIEELKRLNIGKRQI